MSNRGGIGRSSCFIGYCPSFCLRILCTCFSMQVVSSLHTANQETSENALDKLEGPSAGWTATIHQSTHLATV
jgi:hypothetical protein